MIPKSEITMTTWPMRLKVHHFDPKPEEIHIKDIAHHLAMLCRFMGGVPFHYSVAQHSIHVDDVLRMLDPKISAKIRMHALLHDGADTYWGDLHSQAKRKIRGYQQAYKRMEAVIWKKFQLDPKEPALVKRCDGIMLSTELARLKNAGPHIQPSLELFKVRPWSPTVAEKRFMKRYAEIRSLRLDAGDFVLTEGV